MIGVKIANKLYLCILLRKNKKIRSKINLNGSLSALLQANLYLFQTALSLEFQCVFVIFLFFALCDNFPRQSLL